MYRRTMKTVLFFSIALAGIWCQELESEVRPNLVLWLDASRGVEMSEATKTVTKWSDQSGGGYSFAQLSAAQHRAAAERWLSAVRRQSNSKNIDGSFRFIGPKKLKKAIQFPVPLVANNLQLRDGITAFFVITPHWLQDGEQAIGQRFFGHYPFGQFRFLDKQLAFKGEHGNHIYSPPGGSPELTQGETIIAAYRFDTDVQMSINGMPFHTSRKTSSRLRGALHHGKPPVFSNAGYVTLGGCPPHNSFIGDIAEIMIFGLPLDDDTSRHVAEVLADKHGLTLAEPTASRAFQRNALPLSHDPTYQIPIRNAITPMIPQPHLLLDTSPEESEDIPTNIRAKGRDRVAAYKRHKKGGSTEDASASISTELATQLRETQAKLEQLQSLVQQQQRQQPVTVSTAVASPSPPLSINMCSGGDAFKKESLSKWTPPPTAKLEDIQKWTTTKEASDNAIRSFPRGGKELREFVHKQVSSLRLLRHNMFCSLAVPAEATV